MRGYKKFNVKADFECTTLYNNSARKTIQDHANKTFSVVVSSLKCCAYYL